MAEQNPTEKRILEGALRVLAQRGLRRFSITDACDEAAISRGTLYRYFKSRDEVLAAVGLHVLDGFRHALEAAIKKNPDPSDRVSVVVDVLVSYTAAHPESVLVLDQEPAFALHFLRTRFPTFKALIEDALEPAIADLPLVQDGQVSVKDLAELLLRIGLSTVLIPTRQRGRIAKVLGTLWNTRADIGR